ncbi:MAG: BON domain-containing protein [Pseudomonadota bacterium]
MIQFLARCVLGGVLLYLSGCAGVIVGGAGSAALMAQDERTPGSQVEDQTIELNAYALLKAELEIKEQTHLSVTSYNQIVLLTGQAPSQELIDLAIQIVAKIDNVKHIHNEIALAAPSSLTSRTSDGLLTAKVKSALFANAETDFLRIKVVTETGTVFLMGIVSESEGAIAAEVTSKVGGVQKVVKLFEYRQLDPS